MGALPYNAKNAHILALCCLYILKKEFMHVLSVLENHFAAIFNQKSELLR